MRTAIGIDVGGTAVKFGLVDETGAVRSAGELPMEADAGIAGMERTLRAVLELFPDQGDSVGLGMPGALGGVDGEVLLAPPQIQGVQGWHAARFLREVAGRPAAADNDATVAALGEARVGAGRGRTGIVLVVTLGTGLGGGIVIDGVPLRGSRGTGGEIGHAILHPHGLSSAKQKPGAFELYASATALLRRYRERGGEATEARGVVEAALEGDALAIETVSAMAEDLGIGLASASSLIAPDLILVGGGLVALGDLLLEPTREAFAAHALPLLARTPIEPAALGNQAGLVGAGLLALTVAT